MRRAACLSASASFRRKVPTWCRGGSGALAVALMQRKELVQVAHPAAAVYFLKTSDSTSRAVRAAKMPTIDHANAAPERCLDATSRLTQATV